jgi:hypothetical protein
MKKSIIISAMLLLGSLVIEAQQVYPRVQLPLNWERVKTYPIAKPIKRSPACPPTVEMYDHTLYFEADHPTYTLMLVDEFEEVAYEVTIPSTVEEVELPSTLVGNYELQLYGGGEFYFYCDIELE